MRGKIKFSGGVNRAYGGVIFWGNLFYDRAKAGAAAVPDLVKKSPKVRIDSNRGSNKKESIRKNFVLLCWKSNLSWKMNWQLKLTQHRKSIITMTLISEEQLAILDRTEAWYTTRGYSYPQQVRLKEQRVHWERRKAEKLK